MVKLLENSAQNHMHYTLPFDRDNEAARMGGSQEIPRSKDSREIICKHVLDGTGIAVGAGE
jgi:hypothetical protein